MNAVLMNGDTAISLVITMEEAQDRFASLKGYYPNLSIKQTDQEIKEKFVYAGEVEEVEDLSCAGGACTL